MKTKSSLIVSLVALSTATAFAESNFNRISSFPTHLNNADGMTESSAEIIAATDDGMMLAYTDSGQEALGLVDITDAANPSPAGAIALDGEPTSVAIMGKTAYVGVNTSESFTNPSGKLVKINLETKEIESSVDLGGQPDSIAVAKDGSFVAVAIENERDEDLGDGRTGQMPAGFLALVSLADMSVKNVDLTGLAEISPEDPEPEFVDINGLGETIITMQENNHLAVVNASGEVVAHFSAGSVTLENIDTVEEGALNFTDTQENVVREPDAVKWIDDDHFATANEGDMDGGSRGWTIFNKSGDVVFESNTSFENELIKLGHYPDKRSGNKGVEPESIETGTFNGVNYVFVGSERGSAVGVYNVSDLANPVLEQILPSGIGPEGYVTIAERGLLVSANEVDLVEDGGPRAHVMLFEKQDAPATYPMLTSEGMDELTGWGAISGMVADADGMIYAVNDSFYRSQPTIFKIDPSTMPAKIVDAIRVTRDGMPAQKMDMEGITLDGEGGFWIASEGRNDRLTPHAIYHVNADGEIEEEIAFPAELLAVEKRFGAEGITLHEGTLWIAIQREWADDAENHVKLVSYNLESEEWGAVSYPKAAADKGWVGLSEIAVMDNKMLVIERDNQFGDDAHKVIKSIPMDQLVPAALGGELPVVTPELHTDLAPLIKAKTNGYIVDKVEGIAIAADGTIWISTDNDGVDDSSGETYFFAIGK